MLHLIENIVLVYLDDNGVLALIVAALGKELILDLAGSAAEAHFMQLRKVVAQAHTAVCSAVDKEIDQLHNALGRLIERVGARIAAAHLFEQAAALHILARKEAIEHEARQIKARDRQRRDGSAAAWHANDRDTGLDRGLDKLITGVRDAGGTGITYDGDILPGEQFIYKILCLAIFIELMVRDKLIAYLKLIEQHHRAARILGGDHIRVREDLPAARGHIL